MLFKVLLKYLLHNKMKYGKQICVTFIDKLCKNIQNTGKKVQKCIVFFLILLKCHGQQIRSFANRLHRQAAAATSLNQQAE